MKQGRILIVEDERSMADALHAKLNEAAYDAVSDTIGHRALLKQAQPITRSTLK